MATIDVAKIVAEAPPVPDKHSIIPIHTSDRALFKRCRRKWDWTSPIRENLIGRVDQRGIYFPLWFGTGIHYALEQFYHPVLQRDPVEAFIWWYELVWKGGIVTRDQLRLTYDRKPQVVKEGFKVEGLRDLMADPDPEEFETHRELGIGMMEFYKQYSDKNDNFAVIAAEHDFSIPLGFAAHDPRDNKLKDVHYRGRIDTIVQELEYGRFGIWDHKTAAVINEDYFRKLEKDEQCTGYLWSGEQEAAIHDLAYEKLDYVIYNAILKAYPRMPTMTTKGLPSVDRQKESTTYEMFLQCISENNLQVLFKDSEKLQAYANYLQEIGDDQFIARRIVTRNRAEIESAGERIKMEAMDMLGNPRIYPNPTGDWLCLNCPFRAPCIARDDGSDWEAMLEDNFEKDDIGH